MGSETPLDLHFSGITNYETRSKIENTKAIALVVGPIFSHSKGGLLSTPASRSGRESIATRLTFLKTTR